VNDKKPISKPQIQLTHIAKAQLKLTDDAYRSLLMERYPNCFGTCKDLNFDEATDLINHFKKMGFKIVTKRYSRGQGFKGSRGRVENIIQLVSPQQLAKIEHLRADIRWHVHDGYFRWLKKWLKKDRITTGRDANSVIEGLKGMLGRQQKAKEMEQRTAGEEGLRRDGSFHGGRWQW
jgi:hypothetical protein